MHLFNICGRYAGRNNVFLDEANVNVGDNDDFSN